MSGDNQQPKSNDGKSSCIKNQLAETRLSWTLLDKELYHEL